MYFAQIHILLLLPFKNNFSKFVILFSYMHIKHFHHIHPQPSLFSIVSFEGQKFAVLKFSISNLCFVVCDFGVIAKNPLPNLRLQWFTKDTKVVFSSKTFIVWPRTVRPLVDFCIGCEEIKFLKSHLTCYFSFNFFWFHWVNNGDSGTVDDNDTCFHEKKHLLWYNC
jgi:hypothetical protein